MKIFIQIASYRDNDLVNTILSLLNNALYPNNLSFGICDQYSKNSIIDYSSFNFQNIRTILIDYKQSRGACWARNITQSLYNGQDFTLQLDSHSRCENQWDSKLIDLYSSLDNPKAVISTYPSMFTPEQSYNQYDKTIYKCHVYKMKDGLISARPARILNEIKPVAASAIAAGFVFGPGSIIKDIPYDPEFYFTGEEAALAVRLFTHGYDLYHPNINLFYHYYTRKEQHKHWTDHSDWIKYNKKASSRLNALLGRDAGIKLGRYGLGDVRSLEEWRIYSGIDYVNKKIHKDLIENKGHPPYQDNKELWVDESHI